MLFTDCASAQSVDAYQQEHLMSSPDSDITFTGSIPKVYENYLVPLIFAPFAEDMAARLARHSISSVLEIAAGTGGRHPGWMGNV